MIVVNLIKNIGMPFWPWILKYDFAMVYQQFNKSQKKKIK